jgi:hypothetical protein
LAARRRGGPQRPDGQHAGSVGSVLSFAITIALGVVFHPNAFKVWANAQLDRCFVVSDHNGQQLAYVYYESEPSRRSAAKLLSKDEARRMASNMAKLPDLLGKGRR